MRVAVIGAGVVGVTTAYVLARQGHTVSVIERAPRTAMESSHANGGQLSFGFAAPMGSPDLLPKIGSILAGRDPAFRLTLPFLLKNMRWSLRFGHACLAGPAERFGRELLTLAAESRTSLDKLCADTDTLFARRRAGKLIVYQKAGALTAACDAFARRGLDVPMLDRDGCINLDPATASLSGPLAGGLWIEDDEVGDAEQFSRHLAAICATRYGVEFLFNESVQSVRPQTSDGMRIVTSRDRTIHADATVVCTGAAGKALLQDLGIRLPIVPVTGYSLTAPPGPAAPNVAITDADRKLVCSRIGDFVRIAGFADFGRPDDATRQARIQQLIRAAKKRLPYAADYEHLASTWSGVRPVTPTSLPVVGPSGVPGIFLNMGHGMYGWTLSTATAEYVAQHIGATVPQRSPA